ncbi:MAG: hypothetical protein QOH20_3134 [Mycobacterium sp.]|nr:hypothetical protein [Mycobacterium sp.]
MSLSAVPDYEDDEDYVVVLGALDAAVDALACLDVGALTHVQLLDVLERTEVAVRRLPVSGHRVINRLKAEANPITLGATSLTNLLTERLRISRTDAARRIDCAKDLGPRTTLLGEPLDPILPRTAKAQARGDIGAEHIKIIRGFFTHLPDAVAHAERDRAEATLARVAATLTPEELQQAAKMLLACLHPDGDFSDADRAHRRGVTVGPQGPDGMSPISGYLDPHARAIWDAVMAAWAAPGKCNPDDDTPTVDGDPDQATVNKDHRTPAQRHHDALAAMGQALLASGQLGTHHGLLTTIVITTSLADLEAGTGHATTASGVLLPMADVIQMAAHAHPYLAVFDQGTDIALNLYRAKRTASPGQWLVLAAKHRGCTYPGCTITADHAQAHHATLDWGKGGQTNINDLTLACGPHNNIINTDGWTTRQLPDGRTQWIRPPHLNTRRPTTNNYHHPERMLTDPDDEDPECTD